MSTIYPPQNTNSGNQATNATADATIASGAAGEVVTVDGSGNIQVQGTATIPTPAQGISPYNSLGSGGITGFVEDFGCNSAATVSAVDGLTCDNFWLVGPITAGTTGTVAGAAGTYANPGQITITSTATSGDGDVLYRGNAVAPLGILGANAGWQLDFWVQIPATITNYALRCGYCVSGQQATDPPTGGSWIESDTANTSNVGGALTAGSITGGTLYTTGTYTNVPITGGSGSGALATVVVSGGAVTTVTFTTAGSGYKGGDTGLSAAAANIGGTGSGFSFPLAAGIGPTLGITQNWNYRTVSASTSNYIDSTIILTASDWYHMRVYSTSAGTIAFQVGTANGALSTAITTTTDVDSTHACLVMVQVLPRSNATKTVVVDRISYIANTGRV